MDNHKPSIPSGIDNAFAGLLGFTVSGLSNGGSTSTTISLPQGLNTLDTAQLAYLRFNYATNRFEDFVDAAGTPLYSFQDSNGDGQLDSVVLQLIDGDPAWDGDGIANGSIIDPGFLATGDRTVSGNNKDQHPPAAMFWPTPCSAKAATTPSLAISATTP